MESRLKALLPGDRKPRRLSRSSGIPVAMMMSG